MSTIVPVSSTRHGNKSILPLSSFSFAKQQNLIPVIALEFAQAAREFPIVFVENNGKYGVFVLCGLHNGENLFVDAEGRWSADYVPATLRRYPFVFAKGEDEKGYVLCIDEDSGLLVDEGATPLFNAEGEREPALDKALTFVSTYQKSAIVSEKLCDLVQEHDLLKPLNLELKGQDGKTVKMNGLLTVDEKKLNALSDDLYLTLRSRGFLSLIYAHLLSLGSLNLLVRRMSAKAAVPAGNVDTSDGSAVPDRFSF